jgi:hypothetical protein
VRPVTLKGIIVRSGLFCRIAAAALLLAGAPPRSMTPGTPLPDELAWLQVSEYPDRAVVRLYAGLTLEPGDLRVVAPGA